MAKSKIDQIHDLLESGKAVTMEISLSSESDKTTRYENVIVRDYYYPAAILLINGREETIRVARIKHIEE
ncbi:hypothetical protein [Cysteiniphilum litorale]|uniref:hypothetical protein n=1 Tax=Cysteiniphilum litorale TaxID=2056700 RepID=UPI003F882CDC